MGFTIELRKRLVKVPTFLPNSGEKEKKNWLLQFPDHEIA